VCQAATVAAGLFEKKPAAEIAAGAESLLQTERVAWFAARDGTRSFAVIMQDPDAPRGTFTHWLAYDIPARDGQLDVHGAKPEKANTISRSRSTGTRSASPS
jgi:phosphatidylethanolamine-binding protein (PEBP) family uncharacterized protein